MPSSPSLVCHTVLCVSSFTSSTGHISSSFPATNSQYLLIFIPHLHICLAMQLPPWSLRSSFHIPHASSILIHLFIFRPLSLRYIFVYCFCCHLHLQHALASFSSAVHQRSESKSTPHPPHLHTPFHPQSAATLSRTREVSHFTPLRPLPNSYSSESSKHNTHTSHTHYCSFLSSPFSPSSPTSELV